MENIIDIHPNFVRIAEQLVIPVQKGAITAIPIIIFGLFGVSYIQAAFSSNVYKPNYSPVIRALIILIILFSYQEIIAFLSLAISGICMTVPKTPALSEEWKEMFSSTSQFSGFEWPWAIMETIRASVYRSLLELFSIGIRTAIEFLRDILLVFLYITGPIALLLGLIPVLKKSTEIWIRGFIGTQLWIFTIRIIDQIVSVFYTTILGDMEHILFVGFRMSIFLVIVSLMYLMVPALTRYFVHVSFANEYLDTLFTTGAHTVSTVLTSKNIVTKKI